MKITFSHFDCFEKKNGKWSFVERLDREQGEDFLKGPRAGWKLKPRYVRSN